MIHPPVDVVPLATLVALHMDMELFDVPTFFRPDLDRSDVPDPLVPEFEGVSITIVVAAPLLVDLVPRGVAPVAVHLIGGGVRIHPENARMSGRHGVQ